VTRPVIGITVGDADRPGFHAVREDYVRSVEQANAVPLVLPNVQAANVAAFLDRLDGILLSGGVDVDPALYGQAPHARLGRVDRKRDDFELALTREALRRDLPILAICRGQQVLNVATGGTLVQDIPSELNSFHHQAIDRLGAGLVVSARSAGDGVVEGVEIPGRRFVVAVQWHPEAFWGEADSFQPLFDAHAAACLEGSPVRSR
jgi:putative glutamine amidotransferase